MDKIFYQTILNHSEFEIPKIKWSRFIGNVFNVRKISDIDRYLKFIKTKYFDSRHNCFAYRIRNKIDIFKYSDDGEPTWTAWKPIMNIINKYDITNILVIITRYFGWTKLWTGWLIKAYTHCTKQLLDNSNIEKVSIDEIISFEYSNEYIWLMMKLVKDYDLKVLDNKFLNWKNIIKLSINVWLTNKFRFLISDKSNGNIIETY